MSKRVDITDVQGVITNADLEDVPENFASVLQNMRSVNGKLVKTFGIGDIASLNNLPTVVNYTLKNIYTYIHNDFATVGYRYIAVYLHDTTQKVTIKLGAPGVAWSGLITQENIYHDSDRNPILSDGMQLRFLPGAVGEISSNEAKPVWIGYIDREFFFGGWTPAAGHIADIATPRYPTTWDYESIAELGSGSFSGTKHLYYKFVPIFDGIQEPLFQDAHAYYKLTAANKAARLRFGMDTGDFLLKRITAIKVYRSSQETAIAPVYKHIKTIPLNSKSTHDDKKPQETGLNAGKVLYEPGYDFSALSFDGVAKLKIGNNVYSISSLENEYVVLSDTLAASDDLWGGSYEIWDYYGGNLNTKEYSGSNGYCGRNTLFKSSWTWATGELTNWVALITSGSWRDGIIVDNKPLIVKLNRDGITFGANIVATFTNGYRFEISGSAVTLIFYDWGISDGASHPLESEVSIKTNGAHAKFLHGRMFQFNTVLDPGNENEDHEDWLAYSELNQLDVMPVSNVIKLSDREGGQGMGLAELFGDLICFKKQAIIRLTFPDPSDPTGWIKRESRHNIGCIAPHGIVETPDSVFFPYHNGIFKLDANFAASADATPAIIEKVSAAIEDTYLEISDKTAVEGRFDQIRQEVVWDFGNKGIWAYSTLTGAWREVITGVTVSLMEYDQNGDILTYDSSAGKLKSYESDESVTIGYKSKVFHLSDLRKEILRRAWVRYKSESDLTMNLYADGDWTSAIKSKTLPAKTNFGIEEVNFPYWCQEAMIEVIDAVDSTTDTQLGRISIEHE